MAPSIGSRRNAPVGGRRGKLPCIVEPNNLVAAKKKPGKQFEAHREEINTASISGLSGAADRRRRIIAIVGASSGNLVEWYDFYAYAFTSIYFASAFFPSGDATSQLLATAGIFAVGFFMRPLGGWLFG